MSWITPALVLELISLLSITLNLTATGHVLLYKRETRSAIGWIGLIWLSPFLGVLLYTLLGVNRIRRKAQSLRRDGQGQGQGQTGGGQGVPQNTASASSMERLPPGCEHLSPLASLTDQLSPHALERGNRIRVLDGGDEAYPVMLRAIEESRQSVNLCTYIFNDDTLGRRFVAALSAAVQRGVAVRVLVDDVGRRYDFPTVLGTLRAGGVPVATFLPTMVPAWFAYMNLRNHRKLLVVDNAIGFTGGLNIDKEYFHRDSPRHPKHDLHFMVEGPVLSSLQQTFLGDWAFTTGEVVAQESLGEAPAVPPGQVTARGIATGPDQDQERLVLILLGALASARHSVRVVTPYFVPDETLIAALTVAVMRGVRVDILLPRQNNLALVQWASTALMQQVLEGGCRVWYSPPPFDHAKLLVVDGAWAMVGSANWDPRSFRLNFEFNLECYCPELAADLNARAEGRLAQAKEITLEDLHRRSLPAKLRDGTARLLSPYL